MKCSKAQRLISDYVDNLLDINDIRILKSHLQECGDCRELLNDLHTIVDNAGELEPIQPSRNSWPEIKRELLRKSRTGSNCFFEKFPLSSGRWAFALSTVLIFVILTPLIYFVFNHVGNSGNDQVGIALNHLKKAEQHYQSAIEAMDRAIEIRDMKFNPELAAVFIKNLEIIDDSIRSCKTAVEKYPENIEARKILLICYRKKIVLLNEIIDLKIQRG